MPVKNALGSPLRRAADTIGQHLWRLVPPHQSQHALLHSRAAHPFQHLAVHDPDPRVVASFTYYNQAPQYEYVYRWDAPATLEPHGFLLTSPLTLLPESMPYYEQVGLPNLAEHVLRQASGRARVVHAEAVVSLREFGDINYYHLYSDVLGRLALLEQFGIGADWPLVTSAALFAKPYFQAMLQRSPLGTRRWIVQDSITYVHAQRVAFCRPMPHSRRTFEYVLDLLHAPANTHADGQRMLLVRKPEHGRALSNTAEVAQLCARYGFRAVDADDLALNQQIALFRQARYVIGIHGAGLTNILFRRGAPLSLLELFPADNIPPHYFWISRAYGYGYHALVGSAPDANHCFTVDLQRLRLAIEDMLASQAE